MSQKTTCRWKKIMKNVAYGVVIALAVSRVYSWLPWQLKVSVTPILEIPQSALFLGESTEGYHFQLPKEGEKTKLSLVSFSEKENREVTLPLELSSTYVGESAIGLCGIKSTSMTLQLSNSQEIAAFLTKIQTEQHFPDTPFQCVLSFDSGAYYAFTMTPTSEKQISEIFIHWHGIDQADLQTLADSLIIQK